MANIAVAIKCNHRKENSSKNNSLQILKQKIQNENNSEKKKILKKKLLLKSLTKNLNLSTSLSNYIDPRILFVYVQKFNLDITKFISKNILEQIKWASDIDIHWTF